MNKTIISFLTACFVLISSISAIGFSTHSTTISRSFDKEEAVAGETIRVTVSLTNLEVNELRGFYYTEQMPAWLAVDTIDVTIDGGTISNYLDESGSSGDVYSGSIPYRWILEIPTDFVQNNPISENSMVEIVYSISSSQTGTFNLDEFYWVGFYQTASEGQRATFGHSENADKQTITFTTGTMGTKKAMPWIPLLLLEN